MSRYWNDFKAIDISEDELCHFGVLGMKWGVRRYQNKDGTLTQAGKDRLKTKNSINGQVNKYCHSDGTLKKHLKSKLKQDISDKKKKVKNLSSEVSYLKKSLDNGEYKSNYDLRIFSKADIESFYAHDNAELKKEKRLLKAYKDLYSTGKKPEYSLKEIEIPTDTADNDTDSFVNKKHKFEITAKEIKHIANADHGYNEDTPITKKEADTLARVYYYLMEDQKRAFNKNMDLYKKWYDLSPEEKKNYAKPDTPRRKIGEEAYKWKTEIAYDMAMIDYYNKLYSSDKKPRANDKTYYF